MTKQPQAEKPRQSCVDTEAMNQQIAKKNGIERVNWAVGQINRICEQAGVKQTVQFRLSPDSSSFSGEIFYGIQREGSLKECMDDWKKTQVKPI